MTVSDTGLRIRVAALAMAFAAPCTAQTRLVAPHDVGPPAEAFARLPAETGAVLSRSGRWLAWMERKDTGPTVIIVDLEAKKIQRTLTVPSETRLNSLVWNDEETLLVTVSETAEGPRKGQTFSRVIAEDVSGGMGRRLPSASKQAVSAPAHARLVSAHTTKPKAVIMWTDTNCWPGTLRCLVEVDSRTGESRMISGGTGLSTGWVVDRDGRPVAREDWDFRHKTFHVFALLPDNQQREIYLKSDADRPKLAGLTTDGAAVVVLDANERGNQAAYAVPLDGTGKRLLFEDANDDVTGVFRDPGTSAIIGFDVGGSEHKVVWLDPEAQRRFDSLQRAFPGRHVHVYGWSEDGSKTLARVQSATSPPVYYLVDFKSHRAEIVAEEYPQLAGAKFGELQEVTYTARDNTPILVYLTIPPGKAPHDLPIVVLPHSQPHERDFPVFDWMAQFIATRGYAVLQPQFRGSTGFGVAFRMAGDRQWGGLMQDDLTDIVRAAVAQGVADPSRICIIGEAYGGYAALAGAAFTPDLYACAAAINGPSDLAAWGRAVTDYGRLKGSAQDEWQATVGEWDSAMLKTKSPINSVGAVIAPVLLIYDSVPDWRREQSEQMTKALNEKKKSVTAVALTGAEAWWMRNDTRTQVLSELEQFLGTHLQKTQSAP